MANNYDFRNLDPVTGAQPEPLSPESLQINGEYLEQVIDGFATLNVKGRELLARETTTQKIGNNDGAMFVDSTHPMRIISVTYQLRAATPKEFRAKFHKLNEKLDTPQSKIVFADQPDLYFTGTMVSAGDVPEGQLEVTGTIEFQCTDPFAYATTKKTYQNTGDDKTVIQFENAGNYPAKVNIKAEMQGDNGFFAAALNGKPYQVGVTQQADGAKYDDAEALYPGSPQLDPSTGLLNDTKFVTVPTDQWKPRKQGAVSLITPTSQPKGRILIQGGPGPQPSERMPVETSITYKLPTDKTTKTEGAKSFSFRFKLGFHSYNPFDSGQIVATVHSKDGKAMASILMQDLYVGKEDYVLQYHVDNQKVYEVKPNIWMLKNDRPNYAIVKYNEKITLISPWKTKTIIAPQLKDVEAYYVSFSFLKWFPYKTPTIYEVTSWNFWEGYADLYHDTPNYFKTSDELYYSSEEYKTYINDSLDGSLMDIGSRVLYAKPGMNQIGFVWSDWVPAAQTPKVTIEVQERWL